MNLNIIDTVGGGSETFSYTIRLVHDVSHSIELDLSGDVDGISLESKTIELKTKADVDKVINIMKKIKLLTTFASSPKVKIVRMGLDEIMNQIGAWSAFLR